jgi:hypothetical protein
VPDEKEPTDLHILRLIVRDLVWIALENTQGESRETLINHFTALNDLLEEDDLASEHDTP